MPFNSKIIITESAEKDLDDIFSYLNTNPDTKNYSKRLYSQLNKTIENISLSPLIFPIYENKFLNNSDIHRAIIDKYALFYIVKENEVKILRILHTKRNIESIIKEL